MPAGSKPGERRGGRQKGSVTKLTQESIDKANAYGITPLDVLLEGMLYYYNLSKSDPNGLVFDDNGKVLFSYRSAARDYAIAAAPYRHPKLSSVQANVVVSDHERALAELE